MKVVLMSMPDVAPLIIHEAAVHMPNLGIASVGGNIDEGHQVYILDLIRKRRGLKRYLERTLKKIRPDLLGLSAMSWQYDTCVKIIRFAKQVIPGVRVALGGYHATLMAEEIAASNEAELIDFIVRGEGEECFRRLVNALENRDRFSDIPNLTYRKHGEFIHNEMGDLLELSNLKLPIRGKKRLTWGYHVMNRKVEVLETSRGCTGACKFCSMQQMYGRKFRTFPTERILKDLDFIYNQKKTRWVFLADDNLVLASSRVIHLCESIIQKNYSGLCLMIQADCQAMANNEKMVQRLAQAGCKVVFLGIENFSEENLDFADKNNSAQVTYQAVEMCHKYGMMVVGGLIFGFPEDDEQKIINNFDFFLKIGADAAYCQILTPYPKTTLRKELLEEGLISNVNDYKLYNGLWANVRTRYLDSDQLNYLFWYYKNNRLRGQEPSEFIKNSYGRFWLDVWKFGIRPFLQLIEGNKLKKYGWEGLYEQDLNRLRKMNSFPELET